MQADARGEKCTLASSMASRCGQLRRGGGAWCVAPRIISRAVRWSRGKSEPSRRLGRRFECSVPGRRDA